MCNSVRTKFLTALVAIALIWGYSNTNICLANTYEQYLKTYNNSISKGDKKSAAKAATKVAEHFILTKEYKIALTYLTQAKTLFIELNDLANHRLICKEISFIHTNSKDYENGIIAITEAIGSSKKLKLMNELSADIYELSLLQLQLNKKKSALKNLLSAFEYSKKGNALTLQKDICLELVRTLQKLKKTKDALSYQSQLREIEDQLYEKDKHEKENMFATIVDEKLKSEMQLELIEQEKNHELEKKAQEINKLDETILQQDSSLNQKEIHLQLAHQENLKQQLSLDLMSKEKEIDSLNIKRLQAKEEAQRQLMILLIVIAVLISAAALILFRSIRQHKEDKRIIKLKNNEIRNQHHSIVESINYAKRIQTAMLPRLETLEKHTPNILVYFKPRDIVSGDFYWFFPLEKINMEGYLIAAVDCTGHGVPGALVSMIGSNLLNRIVEKGTTDPGEILDKLHIEVRKALKQDQSDNNDGMDMMLCKVTPSKNTLEFSGAKNGLVHFTGTENTYYKGDPMPIGGNSKRIKTNFTTSSLNIKKGDSIYLFSDGFQDQFGGPKNRKFGRTKLIETIQSTLSLPPEGQHSNLESTFNNWKKEQKQIDDVLVIGITI